MAKLEYSDADLENSMAQLLVVARGESTRPADETWRNDVKTLMNSNWSSRSLQLQHLFREWVIDIATTPNFRAAVDGLFSAYCRWFALSPEEKASSPGQSDFLFNTIRDLCWRIPVSMQALPAVVLQNQPILRRPAQIHSAYCTSVLRLTTAARLVRRQLVSTVISHILGLDVRLSREVVLSSVKQAKFQPAEVTDLIAKLDQSMDAVFEFTEKLPELSMKSNSEDSIDTICEFFVDVLAAFDAVVFRSSSASHINFILFYACSRYPQLAALLLDHLFARIVAEDKADESRRSALFYFASFVARAKFLNTDQLRTSVEHLSKLAHFLRSKIAPNSTSSTPEPGAGNNKENNTTMVSGQGSRIALFDAAVEALIYVVSFHHATLCSGSLGFRFVRSLKLGDLISCPSDPLSRCRESVVGMFIQVAERYQLSLVDRLSRTSYRTESMCSAASTPGDNDASENAMLLATSAVEASVVGASFFPFDPYLLPHSSQRLRPFYAEFDVSELLAESESDGMESDEDEDESEDETCDFDGEDML